MALYKYVYDYNDYDDYDSPLCSSITPSFSLTPDVKPTFFTLPPVVSLLPAGRPSRINARTVSSELLGFCF